MERVFYWWKIKSANELAQIRSIPMIPILVKYRMKLLVKKNPVTSHDLFKTVPLCSKLVSSQSLQGSADTTCVPKHQRDFVLEIYLCEHTSYSGHRIELCWLAHSRWVQCEFRMRICGALSLSLYRIAYSSMIQSIAPIIFHSKCRELQKFWAARGKMSACLCETTLIMMTPNVGNFSRKHFWMHSNTTWEMSHLCMKRWCTVGVGQKWWETTHGKLAFLNNELLKRGRLNGRTLSFHLTVVICVVHKLKVNRFWLRRGFKI